MTEFYLKWNELIKVVIFWVLFLIQGKSDLVHILLYYKDIYLYYENYSGMTFFIRKTGFLKA